MNQLIHKFIDQPKAPQSASSWLAKMRAEGIASFNSLGIPTVKNEDWKYTNLRTLSAKQFTIANDSTVDEPVGISDDAYQLVFGGGVLNETLSTVSELPKGVEIMSISSALESHADAMQAAFASAMPKPASAFSALNTALFRDGAFIKIGAHCQLDRPIELVFMGSGKQTLALPRNLIMLEDGAKATIIERQLSDDESDCLSNSATEIFLANNAELDFNLIQLQGRKSSHIGGVWVQQAAGSSFHSHTISLGGKLLRNELYVSLQGEGAKAKCEGLYFGRRQQHIDNHTTIHHLAPGCTSHELYKGILDDRARGVFHGRIKVDQAAQHTISEQQNPSLLLSRGAQVDTKPQLEIYADDVKCAHGATVGELDNKQLFYIQSRGVDLDSAKTLLSYAFAGEVIENIKLPQLREMLGTSVAECMQLKNI